MKIQQNEITGSSERFGGKLSFIPSFLFPDSRAPPLLLHIFSLLPVQLLWLVTLQPCALNAEFQHFILRFDKIS